MVFFFLFSHGLYFQFKICTNNRIEGIFNIIFDMNEFPSPDCSLTKDFFLSRISESMKMIITENRKVMIIEYSSVSSWDSMFTPFLFWILLRETNNRKFGTWDTKLKLWRKIRSKGYRTQYFFYLVGLRCVPGLDGAAVVLLPWVSVSQVLLGNPC